MLIRFASLAVVMLTLSNCTWSNKVYGANCERAGISKSSPSYADCVQRLKRDGQAQTVNDLGVAGAVAGGVYGASQPGPAPVGSTRVAPLIGQTVTGYQRVCQYRAPTQVMSMTISSATSCPASITY